MGRTACTEPQWLYKGDLYLYLYLYIKIYYFNTNNDVSLSLSLSLSLSVIDPTVAVKFLKVLFGL